VSLSTPRLLVALVGCLGVGAAACVPTVSAAPPTATPRVSLAVPAEVTSGAGALATGKVTSLTGRGRVQLQSREAGRWRSLASGGVLHGRFRIAFVLDGSEAASVRAALLVGSRAVASSPVRRVQVWEGVTSAPPSSSPPAPSAVESRSTPSQPSPPTTLPAEQPVTPPAERPTTPPVEPPVEPPTEPPVEPPPATDAYWGAWIGPQFTGTPAPEDMNAVTEFEKLSKKPLSLLETFSQWATCSGASPTCEPSVPFPRTQFEKMRGYGAIPLFSWASEGNGEANAQPTFQLADIIAGKFDSYIRRWATRSSCASTGR
jgi:hypothetical protein